MNADKYMELDEITHTLERPDVYMGALNNLIKDLYTYNPETNEIKFEKVNYNTGLLKIFDEIITNASDNLQRINSGISYIDINITDDYISITNDGRGVPIEKNDKNVWIPEMVFTRFRSGSNFKEHNKTTGGKNGLGAKLTSVYSSRFIIDISIGDQSYHQEVRNNCRDIGQPTITGKNKISKDDIPPSDQFITITFYPDFKHLKINENKITADNKKVLFKRCHDLCHLPINIIVNNHELQHLDWQEYVNKFGISNQLYTYCNDRWKVAFGVSNDKFRQISYVNNVSTYEGGEHVKYILDQVYKYVIAQDPDISKITKATFKQKICLIVYAIIDDPSFTSQAKETLSTPIKEFGTTCQISLSTLDDFVTSSNIIELLQPNKPKNKPLKAKRGKLTGIEKLVEANLAGTKEGYKCTLFLCEGLSAKTMCDAGIGILGHNYYGCYPLRGKVLNTRKASNDKYLANREISDVKNIIGLVDDYKYTQADIKNLRYGRVVCVKDADSDGADIMGLILNFFDDKFPELLRLPGFFSEFISPMIKIVYNPNDPKKRHVVPFYNEVEYKRFMEKQTPQSSSFKKFSVEFIKGLATNEAEDVREYFTNYNDHLIEITFPNDAEAWLDMAFSQGKADLRKKWLTTLTPETHLPRVPHKPIILNDFIKADWLMYSYDDCVRSIPSVIDGLKPSQRKILYTLFKMGNKGFNKIKVFQLGGLVAKTANYHHGDISMNETIIGMAQNFTGSGNNIPLLKPFGSFGSRTEYGDDAGAPRYISCALDKLTRLLFPAADDCLMTYRDEDNQLVEPYYYVPIIPTILINGAKGIGTGWSTEIPSFNPHDIINYVKCVLLNGKNKPHIRSYYDKFTGEIKEFNDRWEYYGIAKMINQKVWRIQELPIRYTTSKFIDRLNYLEALNEVGNVSTKAGKDKLDELVKRSKSLKVQWLPSPPIESFENNCAVEKIDFTITFTDPVSESQVMSGLGLMTSIKNTNMVAFDSENKIKRYDSIFEIIHEWFDTRYGIYVERKERIINELKQQLLILSNKCRFIDENIKGIIDVKNIAKRQIIKLLSDGKYDKISSGSGDNGSNSNSNNSNDNDDGIDDDDNNDNSVNNDCGYDYLLNMRIYTLTKEKFEELKHKQAEIQKKLDDYEKLTIEQIWISELNELEANLGH